MVTIEEARALKLKLLEKYQDEAWLVGLGIELHDDGYAVRINLRHSQIGFDFSNTIDGVPVVVKIVGDIQALSDR